MSLNHSMAALVAALAIASTTAVAETALETDASVQSNASPSAEPASPPTPAGSSLLSHLVTGSFDMGTPANAAGVLRFCQHRDLANSQVATTADALVEAQGGRETLSQESAFNEGERGVLVDAEERRFALAHTEDDTARQLCTRIADKAKASFLSDT